MANERLTEADLLGALFAEDTDVEFKAAQGKDGKGELPQAFWESYSAMANTAGGVVLLGIEEKPKRQYRVLGLEDPARVRKQLWDCLNDRDKVSGNLLLDGDVEVLDVETKDGVRAVLRVSVPRGSRKERPVHTTKNPFGNTYLRRADGDYRADDEAVRRMIAERVEDERDNKVLKGFTIGDLDPTSLRQYRVEYANKRSTHVWANLEDGEFLRNLGAYRRDRETGEEGLTAAGLLMFGRLPAIREHFNHYELDYQERLEPDSRARWVDRVTTDGSWSGNLYDFYRLVIQRLFRDLRVPFTHDGLSRSYETPIHEALQEALTNTLIHADYTGRASILVVKRPDLFGFRNPGRMRVPLREALAGGTSDCRNRILQTMFQGVGLGDKAGSGVPTILRNWTRDQHFRLPLLEERAEPEQTLLTLLKVSLIPDTTRKKLVDLFGQDYLGLPDLHRLALAMAELDGRVTHSRLASMSTDHPADVSTCLKELVHDHFLEPHGVGRGTYYQLAGSAAEDDLIDFSAFTQEARLSSAKDRQKEHEGPLDMPPSGPDMPHMAGDMPHTVAEGGSSVPAAAAPRDPEWLSLMEQSKAVRDQKKADLEPTILRLCEGRFLTKGQLEELLGRAEKTLRNNYLVRMVKEGKLEMRFPEKPRSRAQAYRTRSEAAPDKKSSAPGTAT